MGTRRSRRGSPSVGRAGTPTPGAWSRGRASSSAPEERLPALDTQPLTFAERSRLHQRYARLTGRSVNLGYTSLGIVVTAATPAELVAATDAVVAEATRKQPLLRDRLDYRSINSLG